MEVRDSAGLARAAAARTTLLAPYRVQVDCLRAAIAERVPELEQSGGLIATEHSAQGSEHTP